VFASLVPVVALLTVAATPAEKKPAPASTSSKAEVLPMSEMINRAGQALERMRGVLRDTLSKLEEARNSKDVVKLNCVNEKLTQVKGLLRISEQADIALEEDAAKKEELAAQHEYTKVSIASEKVMVLRTEAEQCIGQLAFRTDQNVNVEVEVPTNLPNADPTIVALTPPPPNRPPPSSPVR
jgi:hypothetical protein